MSPHSLAIHEVSMKEHPILFSAEMVRAILDSRKTQTRRVVVFPKTVRGDQMLEHSINHVVYPARVSGWVFWSGNYPGLAELTKQEYDHGIECPYGQIGDYLWVRETWDKGWYADRKDGEVIVYRADEELCGTRWKPSIFMPRWASRITLEVVKVRVERVRDISEEDARAEGVNLADSHLGHPGLNAVMIQTYKQGFRKLWDTINAKRGYSWESNPWVWCISFQMIKNNNS